MVRELIAGTGILPTMKPMDMPKAEKKQEAAAPVIPEKPAEKMLSPDGKKREIAKLEKQITEKEQDLEAHRALRFEPEYYQDYQKMNELDEKIDDIHNELAHLYEKWEEMNS